MSLSLEIEHFVRAYIHHNTMQPVQRFASDYSSLVPDCSVVERFAVSTRSTFKTFARLWRVCVCFPPPCNSTSQVCRYSTASMQASFLSLSPLTSSFTLFLAHTSCRSGSSGFAGSYSIRNNCKGLPRL